MKFTIDRFEELFLKKEVPPKRCCVCPFYTIELKDPDSKERKLLDPFSHIDFRQSDSYLYDDCEVWEVKYGPVYSKCWFTKETVSSSIGNETIPDSCPLKEVEK